MTVKDVIKDPEALTLTIPSVFEAPVDRVWQVWADPRKLERWWGPPTYPATVTDHDLTPGGSVAYFMTGPDGETYPGWWRVLHVQPPTGLEFKDGFTGDDGQPDDTMPTTVTEVRLAATGTGADAGTEMTMVSRFPSIEAMEQLLEMGAVEGMTLGLGQIDDILAGPADSGQ